MLRKRNGSSRVKYFHFSYFFNVQIHHDFARTTITYGAKNRWRKTDHNNGVTETFSVQVGFRWRKFNSDRGQFRVNRGEAETNEGV